MCFPCLALGKSDVMLSNYQKKILLKCCMNWRNHLLSLHSFDMITLFSWGNKVWLIKNIKKFWSVNYSVCGVFKWKWSLSSAHTTVHGLRRFDSRIRSPASTSAGSGFRLITCLDLHYITLVTESIWYLLADAHVCSDPFLNKWHFHNGTLLPCVYIG